MGFLPVQQKVDGLPHPLVVDLAVEILIDHLCPLLRCNVAQQIRAQIPGHRHIVPRPGIAGGVDQPRVQSQDHMALDLAAGNLCRIHIVTVQQVDGLGHHLHVPQLLCRNVEKQILDLRVLDTEALGHILHSSL